MQQVGQAELQLLQLPLHGVEVRLGRSEVGAEMLDLGEQRGDVGALRLRLADGLRLDVALVAQLLDAELQVAPALLQREIGGRVEHESAPSQVGLHTFRLRSQQAGI